MRTPINFTVERRRVRPSAPPPATQAEAQAALDALLVAHRNQRGCGEIDALAHVLSSTDGRRAWKRLVGREGKPR